MISPADAVALVEKSFPKGPESLADHLGIIVETAPLVGCEGWCIRKGSSAIIRVNDSSSTTRQRFTLAHELAHLILGTSPDIAHEPFRTSNAEEKNADQLASELLIPESKARAHLGNTLPVDAKSLERLAKAARVSPIMAACRIVNMTRVLKLQNAAVVFFDANGKYQWRYSNGLKFKSENAARLRTRVQSSRGPIRVPNSDGNTVVCSVIDANRYSALFLQLLPPEIATQETTEERATQLKGQIFSGDYSFQQSVASCLGFIRSKFDHLTVSQALGEFDSRYLERNKWTVKQRGKLKSEIGREFLKLELRKSCRPD